MGEEAEVVLEWKLVCDVAVIGPPNAGKSTLLRSISNARPRVADYPFTTQEPVLAAVDLGSRTVTVAELPALLPGASEGRGLGSGLLQHAERAHAVAYLLDGEGDDCVAQYQYLSEELERHPGGVGRKPHLVVVNKGDLPEAREQAHAKKETLRELAGTEPMIISAATGTGVDTFLSRLTHLVPQAEGRRARAEPAIRGPGLVVAASDSSVNVWRQADEFGVACVPAERVARATDLGDWRARIQFHQLLERLGVLRALVGKGVRPGDTVRIGTVELEWE